MYACPCYQSPGSECYISAISALPGPVPAKVTWPEPQLTAPSQPGQMVPPLHTLPSADTTLKVRTSQVTFRSQVSRVSAVSGRAGILNQLWPIGMKRKDVSPGYKAPKMSIGVWLMLKFRAFKGILDIIITYVCCTLKANCGTLCFAAITIDFNSPKWSSKSFVIFVWWYKCFSMNIIFLSKKAQL